MELPRLTIEDCQKILTGDADDVIDEKVACGEDKFILHIHQSIILRNMVLMEKAKLLLLQPSAHSPEEFHLLYQKGQHNVNTYQYLLDLSESNRLALTDKTNPTEEVTNELTN